MQTTIGRPRMSSEQNTSYVLPTVVGGLVLLFFAAPWSLEHKAHAALHGLCAQTPSHTFVMGDRPLPFDARMTGIYGGFVVAFACLMAMGRHRAARLPTLPMMGVLALFVGIMAVDGFNSLLLDLGEPHPYQPDNRLRLVTGMGTGFALAVILCYLFAVTLWRSPDTSRRVLKWRDFVVLAPGQVPIALLVVSGWSWLGVFLTIGLVLAAVSVIAALALIAIVLIRRLDYHFDKAVELQPYAGQAVIVAVLVMGLLAGGRFLLEHLTGIQTLP